MTNTSITCDNCGKSQILDPLAVTKPKGWITAIDYFTVIEVCSVKCMIEVFTVKQFPNSSNPPNISPMDKFNSAIHKAGQLVTPK